MLKTWRALLGLLVLLSPAGTQLLQAQPGSLRQAFRPPAQGGPMPEFLQDRGVVRIRAVELDGTLFDRAAAKQFARNQPAGSGPRTEMNFFDSASLVIRWTGVSQADDRQSLVWTGWVEGMPYSHAVMVVSDSLISANVATGDGRLFQIRSAEDGSRWVREIDQAQFPDGGPPLVSPLPSAASTLGPGALPSDPAVDALADDGSSIDVMVVYTPKVTSKSGGANAAQQLVTLGIAETNLGYQNSGVIQRVRLVYSGEVQYTESGTMQTDLNRLTAPDDGYIDSVHHLRDTYNADLVSLWGDFGGEACGLAWLLSDPTTPRPDRAFSVVDYSCATGYYSFGHEMGHNMGATHAREDNTGPGAYPYSHGYKQPSGGSPFRTIMAYACATITCARVNYWSNPNVNVSGQPSGIAPNATGAAANYLTLNNTRNIIANYRTSGSGSGGSNGFPESDHPYANSTDKTYTFTLPGAAALNVTFDARTSVENGYDFIFITDGNGNQISGSPVTGNTLANRTVTVPGATVNIRLVSDGSFTDYGFKVASITATGGAGSLPKLVVTTVTAPSTATIGTNLAGVLVGLANQGSAAAGAFRLGLYYSRNRNVTTADIFSGSSCAYDSGLSAGGTTSCNGEVGVPQTLSPGTWYLAAIADDLNKVAQSDRNGNARVADSGTITVSGGAPAELIQPVPGSTLTSANVTFQWSAGTGVSGYSLAIGTAPGGADIYNRDQGTAISVSVSGLPTNGASLYIRLTSRIGSGTVFMDYVVAAVRIAQGNNLPTLVISAFSAPTTATVGVNLHNVSTTIVNHGNANAGAFRIGFYYSHNPTVTTSDVFSGWYCSYEALNMGASGTCSGDIGVPSTLASGTWYLAAIADDQGNLQQSDRSGNIRDNDAGPLTVSGNSPATILSPLSGSTLSSSGVTFRWDSGSGADDYYIYIGNTAGNNDVYDGDQGLSLTTTISGLPTDGRLLYLKLWTLFGDTWIGNSYTYRAFRAGASGSAPRIVITSFSAPVSGTIGVNLQGTQVSIVNQGNANAGPFHLGYYFSRNSNVTTADFYTGWFCNVSNGLAVGSTFNCGGDVGVPTTLSPGQWYLAVIADDQTQLSQTDRSGSVRVADTGRVTLSAGSGGTGGALPESSHPYANNTDRSWTYTAPGNPSAIKVAFDAATSVENGYDFIYVYDGTGAQIPHSPFTGAHLATRTLVIVGGTVRIRLVSDASISDYGFRVTSIADAGALPQLVVTSFLAPTTGKPGVNLQNTLITVANQGTADAGPFNIGFYYGKAPNVTPNDTDSGWFCSVDAGLAAGATFTCGGELGVPLSLAPGTWYLAAIADDQYVVDQSDRRGNARVNDNGPVVITAADSASDQAIRSDSATNLSSTTRKRPN